MLFWEKSVEYYFVKKFVPDEAIIAPLDGNHERAGDAIFGIAERFLIIEFKRDKTCLTSERRKFRDFDATAIKLRGDDYHHFLIYHDPDCGTYPIVAQTYFSGFLLEDIGRIHRYGIDFHDFNEYLVQFLNYKIGGGTSSGAEGFAMVAGVTSTGDMTAIVTLEDYVLTMAPGLAPALGMSDNLEPEPPAPKKYPSPSPF